MFTALVTLVFLGLLLPSLMLHAQQQMSSLRGTVIDKTRAAVPSAKVTVTSEQTGEQRVTYTNQSGEFEISQVPVGKYKVRVERLGFSVKEADVDISIGEASSLEIMLFLGSGEPLAGTIKVKVIDQNGLAVAGATVTITAQTGATIVSKLSGQDGRLESNAGPGDYKIKVTLGTSQQSAKHVRLKSGQTKEVKLILK